MQNTYDIKSFPTKILSDGFSLAKKIRKKVDNESMNLQAQRVLKES